MTIWSELSTGHRRSLRAAVAAILAVAFSLLFMPPARAETMTLLADEHAWFWDSNRKVSVCIKDPVLGVCVTPQASEGVKEASGGSGPANPITLGHMGVAMKDGSPDMRSYVVFNIADKLPPGAQVSKMVVELQVSKADEEHTDQHRELASEASTGAVQVKPPATVNQEAASIMACAATEGWAFAHGEPPYSTTVKRPAPENEDPNDDETEVSTEYFEPFADCSINAFGEVSKDGSIWTFDITNIAKKWQSLEILNYGIQLKPDPKGVSPTWTLEFHGAPTERRVTVGEERTDVQYVTKKQAARAIVEFSGGGGFEIPPPVIPPIAPPAGGGFTPPAFTPPAPVTPPVTPPGPPPTTGGGVAPVGGKASTNGWVFALIPLGLLGFGLVSSAVGPDPIAAAAGGGNRVARVLRERRLGGAESLAEAATIAEEEITEITEG